MKKDMPISEFFNFISEEIKKLQNKDLLEYVIDNEIKVLRESDLSMDIFSNPEELKKFREEMIKKAAGWNFAEPIKILSEKKYSEKANDFIGKEISHLVHDKGYKQDRAVAAAINVAKDKGYKVPKKTNESEKPSAGLSSDQKSNIAKKAKAGEDIGKPGKNFKDVAAKAAREYGSEEAGKKVAAAAMYKNAKR